MSPCLLSMTLILLAPTSGDPSPPNNAVVVGHCDLEYERVTTLGAFILSQSGGRVEECHVRPGDRVRAGQVLGRLHDGDAVVELERLKLEAESDVELRLAEAKHAVALSRFERAQKLGSRGLTSLDELETLRLDVRTHELQVEHARLRRSSAELERKRMEIEVRSRELVAPHDGKVVEILKNVGETCACNEPILKIVRDDRLKVSGYLDVGEAWRVQPGHRVRVQPEIKGAEVPIEAEVFEGVVVFVDPRIDPETRTCMVVAEVENRDGQLRSGIQAAMEIILGEVRQDRDARTSD